MAGGYDNLIPFSERSEDEARIFGAKGGRKSGEVRRQKANFKRTLNMLLSARIDSPEWASILSSVGIEPTMEAAVNMSMIKEAIDGNVKAYEAIAKYSGQDELNQADPAQENIQNFLKAINSSSEDMESLFEEEDEDDGEATEDSDII